MRNNHPVVRAALAAMSVITFAALAQAQATRTWVSGVGDDANPCSRTAPCKTFAGAISKTAAGGEINAIDPGGYGTITITRSITIDGTGAHASILASGANGVIVNDSASAAPNTARVALRNLSINGAGATPGSHGVMFLSGRHLVVEGVVIDGFKESGINVVAPPPAQVFIKGSTVRNNAGRGVGVVPGAAWVVLRDTDMVANGQGLYAEKSEVTAIGCVFAHNTTGVGAGPGSSVRLSGASVVANTTGLEASPGGAIISLDDNAVQGNQKDGQFTPPAGPPRKR